MASRTKTIVIDACCLGRKKTGNETYIRGLLDGLSQVLATGGGFASDLRFIILTTEACQSPRHPEFEWINIPLGNFATRNFLTIPRILKETKADLYHASYWTRFWHQPCPSILMVHDLSFVSFPQGFHRHEQIVYSQLVRQCAIHAQHLLTVSEFSRGELTSHWGIPREKITVTYDGIDSVFSPKSEDAYSQPSQPYILYVGNLHPRKNLIRLLEAFVTLKTRKNIPHRLKIVGQAAWMADDIFLAVRRSHLENAVEFTGYVEQNHLVALYQNAAMTVYPSLYEGFGLPPMEAMACGSPVVTSNSTSLPEVTGHSAVLVDPSSAVDIARGMQSVLEDDELRLRLAEEGPARAGYFTWQGCALSTLKGYQQVLQ